MYLIYIFDVSYDRPANCNERCEHVPRGHPSISVSCRKASTTLPAAKDAAREWFSRGLFLVAMALPGKVSWIGRKHLAAARFTWSGNEGGISNNNFGTVWIVWRIERWKGCLDVLRFHSNSMILASTHFRLHHMVGQTLNYQDTNQCLGVILQPRRGSNQHGPAARAKLCKQLAQSSAILGLYLNGKEEWWDISLRHKHSF